MTQKRQLLIDTALELFYQKGVNTIGINEILKVSGVAKKTLYNHFESKEALTIATLEQRHRLFIEWLTVKLAGANSDQDVIYRLFTALEDWISNSDPKLGSFRGCFFINTAAEFSDQNCAISVYCREHKHHIRQVISQHMTNNNSLLLDAICIMKEGVITSAYVGHDSTAAGKCIEILKQY